MRRREFIELLFLAATGWPHAASAQTSPPISRIAVLMPYGEGEASDRTRSAFEQSLRDLGWMAAPIGVGHGRLPDTGHRGKRFLRAGRRHRSRFSAGLDCRVLFP
jgi:hypothetical protein